MWTHGSVRCEPWRCRSFWLSYLSGQENGEGPLTGINREKSLVSLGPGGKFNVLECDSRTITRLCRSSMAAETRGLGLQVDSMQSYGDLRNEILGESAPSSKKLHLKQNAIEWSKTIVTDAQDEFLNSEAWIVGWSFSFSFFFGEARLVGNCFSRPAGGPIFFVVFSSRLSHQARIFYDVNESEEVFFVCLAKRTSLHPVPSFEHRRLVCAKVLSVDRRIYLAMPPRSKRVHETESSSSASAPKRIRGSASNCGRAGFEADLVMNSHCFT